VSLTTTALEGLVVPPVPPAVTVAKLRAVAHAMPSTKLNCRDEEAGHEKMKLGGVVPTVTDPFAASYSFRYT
tara:strand:- start:2183 stop:2398 length:216 start_codon:yes stop_codon:yes gene_type:complete